MFVEIYPKKKNCRKKLKNRSKEQQNLQNEIQLSMRLIKMNITKSIQ